MLRIADFDALIVDLDGVVTQTAKVHARAWKKLFDEVLSKEHTPFDSKKDYLQYIDGKLRYEGVKSFLESREIEMPWGNDQDDPSKNSICGLGNRKNLYFKELLQEHGVEVYQSTVNFIRRAKRAGLKVGVVSASENCYDILRACKLEKLFAVRVDGIVSKNRGLKGKPEPDSFLHAVRQLQVSPKRSILVEDALSGVEAARRGKFGCIIGLDHVGQAAALLQHGADVVVDDLRKVRFSHDIPSAFQFLQAAKKKEVHQFAIFLDYDGTLTPIVMRPELATLGSKMRSTLEKLSQKGLVAIISGRDLSDILRLVNIDSLFYAGSHGYDLRGRRNEKPFHMQYKRGLTYLPDLKRAYAYLSKQLKEIEGIFVERKKFAIAIHYRRVKREELVKVRKLVENAAKNWKRLKMSKGKKIFEFRPALLWNKGTCVLWLLKKLGIDTSKVTTLYLGDDLTDEDAFKAISSFGVGIIVSDKPCRTSARYRLKNPKEVQGFLEQLRRI